MATADIALFSRFIFLSFPKSEFSNDAKERFQQLVNLRMLGCTHLTLEILRHHPQFESNFRETCIIVHYCALMGSSGTEWENENPPHRIFALGNLQTDVDIYRQVVGVAAEIAWTGVGAERLVTEITVVLFKQVQRCVDKRR